VCFAHRLARMAEGADRSGFRRQRRELGPQTRWIAFGNPFPPCGHRQQGCCAHRVFHRHAHQRALRSPTSRRPQSAKLPRPPLADPWRTSGVPARQTITDKDEMTVPRQVPNPGSSPPEKGPRTFNCPQVLRYFVDFPLARLTCSIGQATIVCSSSRESHGDSRDRAIV
jgi:hypothetical protein